MYDKHRKLTEGSGIVPIDYYIKEEPSLVSNAKNIETQSVGRYNMDANTLLFIESGGVKLLLGCLNIQENTTRKYKKLLDDLQGLRTARINTRMQEPRSTCKIALHDSFKKYKELI